MIILYDLAFIRIYSDLLFYKKKKKKKKREKERKVSFNLAFMKTYTYSDFFSSCGHENVYYLALIDGASMFLLQLSCSLLAATLVSLQGALYQCVSGWFLSLPYTPYLHIPECD